MIWDNVKTLAMDALPWIAGASGALFILGVLLKVVVRPIRKDAKAAAKAHKALITSSTKELKALIVNATKLHKALIASATKEIKAETAAKIDGAQKANEAKIDGAVNEIKAYADGEEKVQDAQIAHLKSVVEENRRNIRNLESFVYRDGKSNEGGGNEPSQPAAE